MGSRTQWATLLTQYADNTTGDITPARLRNFVESARPHEAIVDPAVTDDSASGFDVGHAWVNTATPAVFECVNATAGAAVWVQVYPASGVAWGGITGTLSNQTDLQTALDGKAATSHTHTLADVTDSGTAASAATTDFATAAQGATADTAVQPGDPLTSLGSGAATSGHVPKADGSGGIAWAAESGGGSSDIALADGLVIVKHGLVAATARPAAGCVYWQGSVDPTNRALGDLWLETSAYDS
jgi:hypothetical protein